MSDDDGIESVEEFEAVVSEVGAGEGMYVLRLYMAGLTPNSRRALENIKEICEKYLAGRYELEVIDIYQEPVLSRGEQIIAAPTLVKQLPPPLRKFIGDLSDTERVLVGLDLKAR